MYLLGIDVGGTFTDVVLLDEKGEIRTFKSLTTPKEHAVGILDALDVAAKALGKPLPLLFKEVSSVLHGCTVGTNALITGDVAKIGLITTKGFGDTMIIRRGVKGSGVSGEFVAGESLYDLQLERPRPLVPRSLTAEVTERVNYDGEVIIPLDVEECRQIIRKLLDQKVQGIAICLLWSPVNPTHEKKILELIKGESPEVYENSSCSVDLIPQIREYERMSSVLISTCLKPKMKPYLLDLIKRLRASGLLEEVPVLVMQLHGGVADASIAAEIPAVTLDSGPVGGVVGAQYIGSALGQKNLITMDMGGTSFDVGVIVGGELLMVPIGIMQRYHLMLPMVDVRAIGAGGGSIAEVVEGTLKVGPQSAGADPGPACYGRGGSKPTISDANLILGILHESLASGQVILDAKAARKAIKEHVADKLHMSVEEAAEGIIDIANANMAGAIRLSTVEKGYDPSDFTAFMYGGLGPAHGAALCQVMNIKQMIVPWFASTFSAFGIASSLYKHAYLRLIPRELLYHLDLDLVNEKFAEMENEAKDTLRREGVSSEAMLFAASMDIRFEGQLSEMTVKLPKTRVTKEVLPTIDKAFHELYSMVYSFVPDFPLEVVALKLESSGRIFDVPIKKYALKGKDISGSLKGRRKVYFKENGGFEETNIYDGLKIEPGNIVNGQAIIEYPDTVVVVRPGQKARCDEMKNIVIDI